MDGRIMVLLSWWPKLIYARRFAISLLYFRECLIWFWVSVYFIDEMTHISCISSHFGHSGLVPNTFLWGDNNLALFMLLKLIKYRPSEERQSKSKRTRYLCSRGTFAVHAMLHSIRLFTLTSSLCSFTYFGFTALTLLWAWAQSRGKA